VINNWVHYRTNSFADGT